MKDFNKQPSQLSLIPVTLMPDDACEGCYYWNEQTEMCQHPGNALDACSKPAGDSENYENYIFVEAAA